eukprot:1183518-Rhodomonas_salina.8
MLLPVPEVGHRGRVAGDVRYVPTRLLRDVQYWHSICPVLAQHMLSAYALATRCPALTQRVVQTGREEVAASQGRRLRAH